jgi:hypothetical protein
VTTRILEAVGNGRGGVGVASKICAVDIRLYELSVLKINLA